ncbi:glycosyl hydrolase family 47-domain-containing protein [Aspergillus avenaceus]|uniref:alpha-1,2-Mannosidase n=1 Tax=Aspergillus avenaceus TaxID=36643 RepID=A0A5N6TDL8_ASPAV|nr:glycosyl hydrolase family 47-domain-containing protein [Aspergillus avenaceus]
MFRARRYRVLVVFAAVLVLAFIHFSRTREPPTVTLDVPPPVDHNRGSYSPNSNDEPVPAAPKSTPQIPQSEGATKPGTSNEQTLENDVPSKQDEPSRASTDGQKKPDSERPASQSTLKWKKLPEQHPVAPEEMIKLPTGKSKSLPKLQVAFPDEASADRMKRIDRQSAVLATFQHAWNGYKASAMGHDEVTPLRGGYRDTFNGWGATLVDALDTLWIMGLEEEFSIAVDQVKKIDFTTSKRDDIPVFETAIRYMGGLLGAYDISGHKYDVLLEKAVELGEILLGAFDTPNRMPMLYYRWKPNSAIAHRANPMSVLAELGSLSMEFTRLAQLTKEDKYYDAVARVTNELEKFQSQTDIPGLWPLKVDASGCLVSKHDSNHDFPREVPQSEAASTSTPTPTESAMPLPTDAQSYENLLSRRELDDDAQPATYDTVPENSVPKAHGNPTSTTKDSEQYCKDGLTNPPGPRQFALGALGDSTYEYLPKEYMLLGGLNEQYRSMYEKSMDAAQKHLLFQPMLKDGRDVRFMATVTKPRHESEMTYAYEGEHLTCFVGGMFAIGSKLFGIEKDLDIAAKLTDGCVWAYESTVTGIMPEVFTLLPCKDEPCVWNETEYWSALDPFEEDRIARAKKLSEKNAKKEAKKDEVVEAKANSSAPVSHGSHQKRDPARGNWHAVTSPTDSSKPRSGDVEGRDSTKSSTVSIPSHEEFVQARIKDEHLSPGMLRIKTRTYLLRPEAIESVFIMYRLTGDEYWREKGWKMFEAVKKHTWTNLANSAIKDVTVEEPIRSDSMESFWLAETLKYFYLLFSEPSVVNLDEYVLSTEAHPLKRPVY